MKKFLFIAIAVAFFFTPGTALAQESIESFNDTITIQKNGLVDVTEDITYNFGDAKKHGIFRIIPIYYYTASGTLHTPLNLKSVTDENGSNYTYTVEDWGNDLKIVIGSADKYVTGVKTYRLHYTMQGIIGYFDDYDELYWNVTGNEWEVPIKEVTATVLMEQPLASSSVKTACYQGYDGNTDPCNSNTLLPAGSSTVSGALFSTSALEDGKGLTIVYGFPKNKVAVLDKIFEEYTVEEPGFLERVQSYTNRPLIFTIPLGIFIYCIIRWWRTGRDPKGRGVIVTQFDAPNNLTPAQVGTLLDNKADNRDYSAELIHLAVLGYLSITRIPKTGFFSREDFELTLLKDTQNLATWQKDLIEALFTGKKQLKLSSLSNRTNLQTALFAVGQKIFTSLVNEQYYDTHPQSDRFKYLIQGAIIGVVLGIPGVLLGWMWTLMGLSSGFTYMFSGFAMVKRTQKGVLEKEYIEGLKLYLSVAEKNRLAFHNAPEKDPKVFEKLLPYAIVLGVEKQWADKFASIYTIAPSWYRDPSLKTFNTLVLASSLHTFHSTIAGSFTTSSNRSSHASSGGSGFSGGSSGGGFGGGGGGSW